jgi:ankyrin repeat protein
MNKELTKIEKVFLDSIVKNDVAFIKILLTMSIDINGEPFAPLHRAVMTDRHEIVKILIKAGADVNMKLGNIGWTPLHWAIFMESHESAIQLLLADADFDIEDRRGKKPFDCVK